MAIKKWLRQSWEWITGKEVLQDAGQISLDSNVLQQRQPDQLPQPLEQPQQLPGQSFGSQGRIPEQLAAITKREVIQQEKTVEAEDQRLRKQKEQFQEGPIKSYKDMLKEVIDHHDAQSKDREQDRGQEMSR